ncbi:MAG: glycosyltransferase family 1 protein [Bacteroidetes bacterium]|nr:glycosyltransferase family 1 protein [Bacteroidota bacterium]
MSMEIIKVAVDVRDLQISASGARSYLESVIIEFKKEHPGFAFYFLDATTKAYTGNHFLLKLKEQLSYFLWKQFVLPYQAKQLGCRVLFCSDFMVPYFSLGIKTIPVFHDAFFWEYPEHYNKYWLLFFRNLGLAAAKKSAYVVAPTQYASNQLAKYTGINPNKIKVIGEAPKTIATLISQNETTAIVKQILNLNYILHVGTLEKRKNLVALIQAFKIVRENGFPNLKLVLVGKASNKITLDDSSAIKEAIMQQQLTNDVILTDYLCDAEVQQLYQKAKLYVFPSINEGFGIPVLEAFKYQVPVVISNNTCLPEVAGQGAKSFNPFSVQDMASVIGKVLMDEPLRQSYIEKGNAQLQNFSWDKTAGALMQLFKKAVADS